MQQTSFFSSRKRSRPHALRGIVQLRVAKEVENRREVTSLTPALPGLLSTLTHFA
jgi:hypothetical protein